MVHLSRFIFILLAFAARRFACRDDTHTVTLVGPMGWWLCEIASKRCSPDIPNVNQRSLASLCVASKTVSASGSSKTVAACANVTPCFVMFDWALA